MNPSQTKFKNVKQNSEEWFDLRLGKVTASRFPIVMANYGKAFGDPAKRYAQQLAVERITGQMAEPEINNFFFERGHEYEPFAREAYESEFFTPVDDGGIFINGNIGVSPDGRVGDDGLIEIKTVLYNGQFDRLINGGMDGKYKWQVMGALWVTGRKWCDFVSFCPEMPANKRLFIHRVEPEELSFTMLSKRIDEFEVLIKNYTKLLK